MKYEIIKMLTLSTAHITEETANELDTEAKSCGLSDIPFAVYREDDYGWFICLSSHLELLDEIYLPEDFKACCYLAKENDCEWLRLDRDGEIVPDLPTYDW
jgi:hypothetical protein